MNVRRTFALIAGAVVEASLATPVLAASFSLPLAGSFTPRDYLLAGSVALLVLALALRAMKERDRADLTPPGPDLRWWKNVEP
jgi:hypothetical protein